MTPYQHRQLDFLISGQIVPIFQTKNQKRNSDFISAAQCGSSSCLPLMLLKLTSDDDGDDNGRAGWGRDIHLTATGSCVATSIERHRGIHCTNDAWIATQSRGYLKWNLNNLIWFDWTESQTAPNSYLKRYIAFAEMGLVQGPHWKQETPSTTWNTLT